jgi:hypothetical protein
MNPRSPTVTLSAVEGQRLRELLRERGEMGAARDLGINHKTLLKAASEIPIHRMTGDWIRGRLERL